MATDGSIIIDTKIDDSGLSKGFQRIKNDMGSVAEEAGKMGKDIQTAFSSADFSKPVAKAAAQIKSIERQLATVTAKLDIAKANGDDNKTMRLDERRMELYDKLGSARDRYAIEVAAAAQRQASAEEAAAARQTAAVNKQNSAEKQRQSILSKTATVIKSVFNRTKKLVGLFSGLNKSAEQFGHRLKSIVSGALVFNLISQGLRGVTKYFGSVLRANDEFSAALAKLKGALFTAFQPIYEFVTPALTTIVNLLTRATQAVAQFFATLAGKKYGDMAQNAEALYDTAGGIEAVGKESKKSLAPFDEINTLSDNSDASGGGSTSVAPDFSITEDLNGLISLDATALTTKLNNMIASVDWVDIGGKLAAGIDGALRFLSTAILNFDWYAATASIALMLNEIINNVDWGNLGVILGAKFILLVEGLGGLFATIDWAGLGMAFASALTGLWNSIDWLQAAKTLSDGLIGAITSLSTAIKNIDWQKIGNDVATFIAAIDWNGILVALSDGIGAALGGLAALVWGLVEDAWASVVEWWQEVAFEDGKFTISGLLEGIWEGIKNIGKWIKEKIFDPFIKGFKAAFGIASPSKVMKEQGKFIIDGLKSGITNAWNSIKTFFSNAIAALKKIFSNAWSSIKSTATKAWNGIKSTLSSLWNGVKNTATKVWNGVKSFFSNTWNSIKNTATKVWNSVKTFLTNTWNNVKTRAANAWNNVKTGFSNAWSKIKTNTTNTWAAQKKFLTNTWNSVKTRAANTWNNVKTGFSNAWSNVKNKTSSVWGGIKGTLSNTWGSIKSTASNAWNSVKNGAISAWNKLKTRTSEIWQNVLSVVKKPINGIIGAINGLISGVVNGINTVIRALNRLSFTIPSWVPALGGKSFGFNISTLTAPQIPYLAQGAVIPPNAPFMAVLGDQKRGTNIEAPLATIEQAVRNVLTEGNGEISVNVNFTGNLSQLARVLKPAIDIESKRKGYSLAKVVVNG